MPRLIFATMLLSASLPALSANGPPASRPMEDDPRLPRVLLIGDSISIGYMQPTGQLLKGKANVHRIPANSGDTANVLAHLDAWLGEGRWDVIHFNVGLHDLKLKGDARQVGAEQYEKNLTAIVERLKKTGAKPIWASTTPIPEGTGTRKLAEEVGYNKIAARVMTAAGVPTNDLWTLATKHQDQWQGPKNVHFNREGYQGLAEQVAKAIETALAQPATKP